MGLSDRDYYRHRNTEQPISGQKRSWKTPVKYLFVWLTIFFIFLTFFKDDQARHENNSQPGNGVDTFLSSITPPPMQHCTALPPHGSAYAIEPSVMKRTDVLYSGLEIQNKYSYPMVAILGDSMNDKRFLALSIASDNTVQISVPIGQYSMQILVGSNWCNLETGFSDGAVISVSGGISIQAGSTTYMQFNGSSLQPIQMTLGYRIARPVDAQAVSQPAEIFGIGNVELKQTHQGHYFSSGTINGAPVVFMIDTGATTVSISSEIASRAGIQKCTPLQVSTANGSVTACTTTVPEITFGKFRLTHVDVNILPNMPGDALLGMNVLRKFRIEQVDKVMRISSR